MPTFLVESYLPKGRLHPAETASALARVGAGARYRLSLFLPGEEIAFHVMDASSAEDVRATTLHAELRCQRITEAVLISAEELACGQSVVHIDFQEEQ